MGFGSQILGFGAFPNRGVGAFVPTHAARFDGSSEYLTLKFNEAGNTTTWTYSVWLKRGPQASDEVFLEARADGNNSGRLAITSQKLYFQDYDDGVGEPAWRKQSSALLRDSTTWMNIVAINDTDNGTAADRQRLYVNGVQLTSFSPNVQSSQGYASAQGINTTNPHYIGFSGHSDYFNGYMAESIFLDGIAPSDATPFGEYDSSTGIWVPKNPLAGYGEDTQDKNIADWGGKNSWYFNFSDTNDLGKNFRPTEVTANPATYKIDKSIFLDGSTHYLNKTFSTSGTNRKKITFSCWFKLGALGATGTLFSCDDTGSDKEFLFWVESGANIRIANYEGGTNTLNLITNDLLLDPTAWYHLVFQADTDTVSNANTIKLWLNGVQVTSFSTETYPSADFEFALGNSFDHEIGRYALSNNQLWNGYVAEMVFLDGSSHPASDFGGWDSNGIWMPKDPTAQGFTFGTNGFLIQFEGDGGTFDSNADAGGVGADTSGVGNHFAGNGNVHNNRTTDVPTNTSGDNEGNYATWNPIDKHSNVTLSNGNKTAEQDSASAWRSVFSTQSIPVTGKWIWETKLHGTDPFGGWLAVGVASRNVLPTAARSATGTILFDYRDDGDDDDKLRIFNQDASVADQLDPVTLSNGEAFQFLVDSDAEELMIYTNGVKRGSTVDISGLTKPYKIMAAIYSGGSADCTLVTNSVDFENSSPDSNYKTLNTANRAALTYTDARKYFAPVLYEGAGTAQSVRGCFDSSGTAWTPDWVWIKNRDATDDHRLFDTLRGPFHYLETNSTNNESQGNILTNMLTEFTSGGFKIGDNVSVNTASESYVAWCWEAGGAPTVENDNTSGAMDDGSVFKGGTVQSSYTPSGSPSVYPTKMSIAEHGGFSIINWTGDGTNSDTTIPHGLDAAVEFVITKNRDLGTDWLVKHKDDGVSDGTNFRLNSSSSTTPAASGYIKAAGLTTHTFEFDEGDSNANNFRNNGERYLAYCFKRTPGLIGIGSYTGGGSNAEPYIVIDDGASGFRPAWVMLKNVSANQDWEIHDIAREPKNIAGGGTFAGRLQPSTNSGDSTTFVLRKTSNGFKIVTTGASTNGDGNTFIYLAFADQPFQLQARAL